MEIKILGTGCARCKELENITREVVRELGLHAEVVKEDDISRIMEYGILRTPGLVVDGSVLVSGRLPSKEELKALFIKSS